ncbi:hypothetical protein BASA83_003169 [Batrachochytrium salamandrivorans]|nr:hypothetical protein BASA81_014376 [Batrachochytrium salamandrivorans]KAH9274533.1 hypothetical protein BASA83_003169 [Batrachochytrium salamandrivorans]
MNSHLATELDEFEDYVNSFTSQMNDILKGEIPIDTVETSRTVLNFEKLIDTEPSQNGSSLKPMPPSVISHAKGDNPLVEEHHGCGVVALNTVCDIAPACEVLDYPHLPAALSSCTTKGECLKDSQIKFTEPPKASVVKSSSVIDYSKWEKLSVDDLDPDHSSKSKVSQSSTTNVTAPSNQGKRDAQTTISHTSANPTKANPSTKPNSDLIPRHIQVVFDAVKTFREKGNASFKSGDYRKAISLYSQAIETSIHPPRNLLDCATPTVSNIPDPFAFLDKVLKPLSIAVNPSLYTNRALAWLKICNWAEAKSDCSLALTLDPLNTKALWRRVEACLMLDEFTEARVDALAARDILSTPRGLQTDISVQDVDAILLRISRSMEANAKAVLLNPNSSVASAIDSKDFDNTLSLLTTTLSRINSESADLTEQNSNDHAVFGILGQKIDLEPHFSTLLEMIKREPSLKRSTTYRDWLGLVMEISYTTANQTDLVILQLLIESSRGSPENSMFVGRHIVSLASILAKSKDEPIHSLVVELLVELSLEPMVVSHQFTQTGDRGSFLGTALLATLDTQTSISNMRNGISLASSILTMPADKSCAILECWGVKFEHLILNLCALIFLDNTNLQAMEGVGAKHTLLAIQCLLKITLLEKARPALLKNTSMIYQKLSIQIHRQLRSSHPPESKAMLLEGLLALLHNISTVKNVAIDENLDLKRLLKDLIEIASSQEYGLVRDAYRILPRIAQRERETASALIDANLESLDMARLLTGNSVEEETHANILQLLCIWLQSSNEITVEARIQKWQINYKGFEIFAAMLSPKQTRHHARVIGNTAFCVSECAKKLVRAEKLVSLGIIESLIYHSENTSDPAVLKNIAIGCAQLCKTDKGLEIARKLRWIERVRALNITA